MLNAAAHVPSNRRKSYRIMIASCVVAFAVLGIETGCTSGPVAPGDAEAGASAVKPEAFVGIWCDGRFTFDEYRIGTDYLDIRKRRGGLAVLRTYSGLLAEYRGKVVEDAVALTSNNPQADPRMTLRFDGRVLVASIQRHELGIAGRDTGRTVMETKRYIRLSAEDFEKTPFFGQ